MPIFISPLVFLISDVIIPMVVDFPAPFGPREQRNPREEFLN